MTYGSPRIGTMSYHANADAILQWKVLVVDEQSKKLIDNVVKEDDILNENITSTLILINLCMSL